MIDFRYHIVSLISVFLALAVGIILGAGPLEGPIGDQLTGQVEQLRSERNELREQLDDSEDAGDDAAAYIEAAGPQLVDGSLEDQDVAVVTLGAVSEERFAPIADQFEAAGATLVSMVDVTEAWTGEDDAARVAGATALAAAPADGLEESGADGTDASDTTEGEEATGESPSDDEATVAIAAALAEALVAPVGDVAGAEVAGDLKLLVESGLITVDQAPTAPADVILLLSPPVDPSAKTSDGEAVPTESEEGAATAETEAFPVQVETSIAAAAAETSSGAVVAGPSAVDGDLITRLREDDVQVSTVSGVDSLAGQINVPLALAASITGVVGHYGFEESATAVIPEPVDLPGSVAGAPAAEEQDAQDEIQ